MDDLVIAIASWLPLGMVLACLVASLAGFVVMGWRGEGWGEDSSLLTAAPVLVGLPVALVGSQLVNAAAEAGWPTAAIAAAGFIELFTALAVLTLGLVGVAVLVSWSSE